MIPCEYGHCYAGVDHLLNGNTYKWINCMLTYASNNCRYMEKHLSTQDMRRWHYWWIFPLNLNCSTRIGDAVSDEAPITSSRPGVVYRLSLLGDDQGFPQQAPNFLKNDVSSQRQNSQNLILTGILFRCSGFLWLMFLPFSVKMNSWVEPWSQSP